MNAAAARPQARVVDRAIFGGSVADLYLKALESERRSLWATCRLKGLAKDSPERLSIAEIDALVSEHKRK